jgi:PAS domain S-box-containing protein
MQTPLPDFHDAAFESTPVQEEAFARFLFEQTAHGILRLAADGRLLYANPALARVLGYSSLTTLSAGLNGDARRSLFALPEQRDQVERGLRDHGRIDGLEVQLRGAEGRRVHVLLHATAQRDWDGRVRLVDAFVEDIGGRKNSQAQLERRLQEFEALAVISQALNETHNLDDILRMIVDAARQVIAKAERAVIHLLEADQSLLRSVAASGFEKAGRTEIPMRPGEGIAGRVMAEGQPINVGDIQNDPRYVALGRTPTTRALLVAPVQSKQNRLGTISVQSVEIDAFDEDDVRLLQLLGIQAALAIENTRLLNAESTARQEAEVLGEIGFTLSSTLDLEAVFSNLLDQIARLAPYDVARLMVIEHGHARTAELRGSPYLYEADGENPRYLTPLEIARVPQLLRLIEQRAPLAVADIYADPDWSPELASPLTRSWLGVPILTARDGAVAVLGLERAQPGSYSTHDAARMALFMGPASLAVQNATLYADLGKALHYEQSMRSRLVQTEKLAAMGRLVASVAHELNNPLQAIQNSLFLVKQENVLSPQAREDLQVALTEADRMADLINRLRETYRPAAAEQFRFETLNDLIDEVHKLIATHLRHKSINFAFEPADNLPRILCIRDQIKQVLLNLCLNAVEAMPEGGELRVKTQLDLARGEVAVAISDSGVGINPEDIPSIFDPFFTKKEGGTGLGLFITYEIIERHSGRVEVASELGAGSTFRVWLPAAGA